MSNYIHTSSFKNINASTSMLGFGAMRLPTLTDDNIDEMKARQIIEKAYELGVNYFDTGWFYHNYNGEKFLGSVLKQYERKSYYIATKMPTWEVNDVDQISEIFNKQLINCQVNYFDFYLLHCVNENTFNSVEMIYSYLISKKKDGYIHNLGFSFHGSPELLEKLLNQYDWDFVQIQLNYIDWRDSKADLQYRILSQREMPIIVMEPVRGGELATLNQECIGILRKANRDSSVASWAIRYILALPGILTILSGMSNIDQVIDNVNTVNENRVLSMNEQKVIEKVVQKYKNSLLIPCTGCGYCLVCHNGVAIKKIFKAYNKYIISGNRIEFNASYYSLRDDEMLNNCQQCSRCLNYCPQKIDISDCLNMISKKMFFSKITNSDEF